MTSKSSQKRLMGLLHQRAEPDQVTGLQRLRRLQNPCLFGDSVRTRASMSGSSSLAAATSSSASGRSMTEAISSRKAAVSTLLRRSL